MFTGTSKKLTVPKYDWQAKRWIMYFKFDDLESELRVKCGRYADYDARIVYHLNEDGTKSIDKRL